MSRKILEIGFVCLNKDNKPVGIDQSSGGYPWAPNSIQKIHIWNRKIDAESYARHFDYTVKKVKLTLEIKEE